MAFPHILRPDPASDDFQYLEDMATAYWSSEVLFTAIELGLFACLDPDGSTLAGLADAAGCRPGELARMMRAMEKLALVGQQGGRWYNSQPATVFLVPGKPDYMGDFFLYRKYMRDNFQGLGPRVSEKALPGDDRDLDYAGRTLRYVRAMDILARQKAGEISGMLSHAGQRERVLDVGGGAGSLLRSVTAATGAGQGVLFDLPEVIAAARTLYPDSESWAHIKTVEGDFRTHGFDESFSLVILGNFLHAYGPEEAEELLHKALDLLEPGGMVLIHDYFPDRDGRTPQKGSLYDLAMMMNTYNGACHEAGRVMEWLEGYGMTAPIVLDLSTDSSIIVAGKGQAVEIPHDPVVRLALETGFDRVMPIPTDRVATSLFSRTKCEHGCAVSGKSLQCPPLGMPLEKTREMLSDYTRAILVQGTPPGKEFHTKLLELEKRSFLAGFHKAFVFGAGPCGVCAPCPEDGQCRFPHLSRPSMEGAGMDVYETVHRAGGQLKPVRKKGNYVVYTGLLLVE